MIPNMFKIAGELTPTVFHIAARALATHALSIFGDHSDVMSVRSTGWAMLASNSVTEAQDMAMIAQASTLKSRLPFLHFFDGFRTSHEVNKMELFSDDDIRAMIDQDLIKAHRERSMSPDRPVLRGTAQNPDVFFQAREACNPFYNAAPAIVQETMDRFAKLVGRQYHLFDYVGAPDADRIVVLMGSGVGAVEETVLKLVKLGQKVGVLKVRLFRPFDVKACLAAIPTSVKGIAVLDRTKEPGAAGEPLYQDVLTALMEGWAERAGPTPKCRRVIGGRYGLSSKEFTPAMVKAVLDELNAAQPKNHFTVGIVDDVTHTSLKPDPEFHTDEPDVRCSLFYGLGADGTVGANKNSVKIIGENTNLHAQGYFVYDSKKAGAITVSHLRFSPRPINSTYLIERASFVACHQFVFLDRVNVLGQAEVGATFLLNSPFGPDEVWDRLPQEVQETILQKKLKFYVIDGYGVAKAAGMGGRVNTVMQTCFFALANVLPREEAIEQIKYAIKKTYGKRGEAIVQKNFAAVDASIANLHEVKYPDKVTSTFKRLPAVWGDVPDFVERVTGMIIAGKGDLLPVSAHARGRDVPDGDGEVRETQHRVGNSGLGHEDLHPVRSVFPGLPARRDPFQGVPQGIAERPPGHVPNDGLQGQGAGGPLVHHSSRAGRLHGLRRVRRRLPGQEQGGGQAQGHQHAAQAGLTRGGTEELRLLPQDYRPGPQPGQDEYRQGLPVAASLVRV